jgi:hypothetical protein
LRRSLGEDRRGRELVDPAEDRGRRRHAVEAKERRERVAVDLGAEAWMGSEGLELRTEHEPVPDPPVVQGLLSEPVAYEVELATLAVPEREREHPVHGLQRTPETPLVDGLDQHLGVGVAAEPATRRLQLLGERLRVVDLSVVRHDDLPVFVRQRLRTTRDVHDAQSDVRETDALSYVESVSIGSAVAD